MRLLVTGGASGLGRAIALGAAQRGAAVAVADIDRDGCEAVAKACGGHATLIRAEVSVRAAIDVFEPPDAALAALTKRVQDSFDPKGILHPGRMYAGRPPRRPRAV